MNKEILIESDELNKLKQGYENKSNKLKEIIPQYNRMFDARTQLIDIITTIGLRETVLDALKDKIYNNREFYDTWLDENLTYDLPEIEEFIKEHEIEIEERFYGDPPFNLIDEW